MIKTDNKSDALNPFRPWVAKPLGIFVLLFLFWPATFSCGTYLGNISEMQDDMAIYSESVQMGSYLVFVGMSMMVPAMLPFLTTRRPREVFLWSFAGLALLNMVCATAANTLVLFAACLLMGVLRILVMLNCTFTIAPYLTGFNTLVMFTVEVDPDSETRHKQDRMRSVLMPVLYTYILSIANVCNITMTWVAEHYSWRHCYWLETALLLVALLLVWITMRHEPHKEPWVLPWRHLSDVLLLGTALSSFCFVMAYGKTLDWLSSPLVVGALALCLVSSGGFVLLQAVQGEGAYLPLSFLRYPHVWVAALLFVVLVLVNSSSVLSTTFAHLATTANTQQIGAQGRWAILGCLLGLLLAVGLVVRRVPFRFIFCLSFLLMAVANILLYFSFQSEILLSQIALAIVLMNMGLLPLYALVAAYGMRGLPNHLLASLVFVMIFFRNAVAPPVGSALYANWLYHRQQYHEQRLGENLDPTLLANPTQLTARYRQVVVQSHLAAMKDVAGMTVWAVIGLGVALVVVPVARRKRCSIA